MEILLDTSFLLPTLGVDVEERVYRALKSLRKAELYYLEEGLLEAIWLILKFLDKIPEDVIEEGVEAIRRDYQVLKPPGRAVIDAIKIYRLGHRDYIDALYYTTALYHNVKWLTIDETFIDFLQRHGYKVKDLIMVPKEI